MRGLHYFAILPLSYKGAKVNACDSQIYSPRATGIRFSRENYILTLACIPALRMSFFRHFKLPQILKKQQSTAESIANIKAFDCNALQVKSLGKVPLAMCTPQNMESSVIKYFYFWQWLHAVTETSCFNIPTFLS